jgi:FAD/FMN-containing dehydrogenase
MSDILHALSQVVGQANVITGADCQPFETDWRKRETGKALCVVRPGSTDEVAQIVRCCAQHGVSLVPQGGNTSMVVGAIPNAQGEQVVLSLQRLNRIRHIDSANATITADAGVVLQNLQTAVAEQGFLYPLSLGSEGSCTLGGNLSTNAGGTQVVRYGNTRELCLGLEVVTADGEVWHGLSGLRKDNTGYDLRDLFIGAEGTLGIITAATMKLFPAPQCQLTAWASVASVHDAVRLLELSRQRLNAGLTGFEMMNQFSLSLVHKHFPERQVPLWETSPYCVLMELSDMESEAHARQALEALLEQAIEDGLVADAIVAESLQQAQNLWLIRENITLAQAQEGLNIKHDISLPVSAIAEFCEHTDAALAREIPGVRLVNFGHLGDGNLHYNVQCPVDVPHQVFLQTEEARVNTLVHDAVKRFDGSISAEHGIGSLKVDSLPKYKDPVALGLMRRIKQALDPQGVLNPGRVVRP